MTIGVSGSHQNNSRSRPGKILVNPERGYKPKRNYFFFETLL
uniref:ORF41f n=1 Tax=Pinus koraiensis TaxID=88728 RepID=A4QM37_PINKO|nr:ORF41f [Pinus koraiensis]ABP35366.1 ORF41f [Pinus koraiensis]